jgi:hypothetical protein
MSDSCIADDRVRTAARDTEDDDMGQTQEGRRASAAPETDARQPGDVGAPATTAGTGAPEGAGGGVDAVRRLLDGMPGRRDVLLGILALCREPRPVPEVEQAVRELQRHNESVYSAASLCAMLEGAGAIVRQDADGNRLGQARNEPEVEEVDGVHYLRPRRTPASYWRTTETGELALASDDPADRMRKLLEEQEQFRPVYERILEMCSGDAGATMRSMGDALDNDPLLKDAHLFASHFVEQLESCGALEFTDAWRVTDAFRAANPAQA